MIVILSFQILHLTTRFVDRRTCLSADRPRPQVGRYALQSSRPLDGCPEVCSQPEAEPFLFLPIRDGFWMTVRALGSGGEYYAHYHQNKAYRKRR